MATAKQSTPAEEIQEIKEGTPLNPGMIPVDQVKKVIGDRFNQLNQSLSTTNDVWTRYDTKVRTEELQILWELLFK